MKNALDKLVTSEWIEVRIDRYPSIFHRGLKMGLCKEVSE